ncbi:MAG: cell division protein FtsW [Chloroflexi bacterium]|nr:cell division protein FtsW [Chloroflexota bacterium]
MTVASAAQPQRKKALGLNFDVGLLLLVGWLTLFGMMMVFSTTFDWSYSLSDHTSTTVVFVRQLRSLAVGIIALFIFARVDYHYWRKWAVLAIVVTLGLLVAVLVVGGRNFGATRGFYNGSIQPSEIAKFMIVLYLAIWLTSKSDKLRQFSYGLVPFAIIVGAIAGAIMMEPDLSAALTVVLVGVTMYFLAGADLIQMALAAVLGGVGGWAVVQASSTGRNRLVEYVAGLQDLTKAGWHVQQALIAFVKGGWLGRGLGSSYQKFGFLPTPHTDSVFAIIGEEIGVVGCVAVIALFALLVWRGLKIAANAGDDLGAILAAGVTCWIAYEALINMAVMVAILPFAGNALPFISYGGSSLVASLAGVGLLLNISHQKYRQEEDLPRRTRANFDYGRRDRRTRLSGAGGRPGVRRE